MENTMGVLPWATLEKGAIAHNIELQNRYSNISSHPPLMGVTPPTHPPIHSLTHLPTRSTQTLLPL